MTLHTVQGQSHAIEVIRRALANERLHHAYLFAGPRGVGKGMTAWALAQALFCEGPAEAGDGCGRCNTCLRVAERQHPDLHIVTRKEKSDGVLERQIRIDQVRALQKALSFKSFEGARRVVIILEPETMNASTANALLKTLEEPGQDTHFILVCASPHRLLPTIISRCQRIRFSPLTDELVSTKLREHAEMSLEHSQLLARLSEGSIGQAMALADSEMLGERARLFAHIDPRKAGAETQALLDLAEGFAKPDRRDTLKPILHLLRSWYRDLLILVSDAGSELVHTDHEADLRARAEKTTVGDVTRCLELLNEADEAIFERNGNARLNLESMFLGLVDPRATEASR